MFYDPTTRILCFINDMFFNADKSHFSSTYEYKKSPFSNVSRTKKEATTRTLSLIYIFDSVFGGKISHPSALPSTSKRYCDRFFYGACLLSIELSYANEKI